jgi:hypothetical protein
LSVAVACSEYTIALSLARHTDKFSATLMPSPELVSHEDSNGVVGSRRNLPRASHACQQCRAKKGKCDQQQPCSRCVRHAVTCVYGLKRKNGRGAEHREESLPSRLQIPDAQLHVATDEDRTAGSPECLLNEGPGMIKPVSKQCVQLIDQSSKISSRK